MLANHKRSRPRPRESLGERIGQWIGIAILIGTIVCYFRWAAKQPGAPPYPSSPQATAHEKEIREGLQTVNEPEPLSAHDEQLLKAVASEAAKQDAR